MNGETEGEDQYLLSDGDDKEVNQRECPFRNDLPDLGISIILPCEIIESSLHRMRE